MAITEDLKSRSVTWDGPSSRTGERVWVGPIDELMTESLKHPWGTVDFPAYGTPASIDKNMSVQTVKLTPDTATASGDNWGRLVITYSYGTNKSDHDNEMQDGYFIDQFDGTNVDQQLCMAKETSGALAKLTLAQANKVGPVYAYQWNQDSLAFELKPTEIRKHAGGATYKIKLITSQPSPYAWTMKRFSVNKNLWAKGMPGVWLFYNFNVVSTRKYDKLSGALLFECNLEFCLNIPGWNKNQFGLEAGLPTIDGAGTKVFDYELYPSEDFATLFPQLNPTGQQNTWYTRSLLGGAARYI